MANEKARSLRKNKTSAERRLWWYLRGLKPRGCKFRQQAPIDRYVVDFVCLSHRIIVEVDGATHGNQAEPERDARRANYLESQGFKIIRGRHCDVYDNIQGVMELIVHSLEGRDPETPTPSPSPQGGGEQKVREAL